MHTFKCIIVFAFVIWVLCRILKHIRYVTVLEATAVAFKYQGRFVYMAMEYAKHCFNASGDVVTGNGPKGYSSDAQGCVTLGDAPQCWCMLRWGGWVIYLSPFVRPAAYTDTNNADNFGDGIYVRLNQITPEPTISMAETTEEDEASVPLDIKFVATMGVMNPYKWLFVAPKNVYAQVTKRLDSILRSWVKSGSEKHAQSMKGNGDRLWKELVAKPANPDDPAPDDPALNCGPIIVKMKEDWGLEIVEKSIIAQDIGYDAEYQQAMQAKSKADLLADGDVQATAGRLIKTVAESVGLTVKQLKAKLAKDPTLRGKPALEGGYKEAFSYAEDQVKLDRGAVGGVDQIRIGNPDGSPLSANLSYLSIGGGGGAGVFVGGKKGRQNNDNRGGTNNRGGGNDRNNQKKVLDASEAKPIEDMSEIGRAHV